MNNPPVITLSRSIEKQLRSSSAHPTDPSEQQHNKSVIHKTTKGGLVFRQHVTTGAVSRSNRALSWCRRISYQNSQKTHQAVFIRQRGRRHTPPPFPFLGLPPFRGCRRCGADQYLQTCRAWGGALFGGVGGHTRLTPMTGNGDNAKGHITAGGGGGLWVCFGGEKWWCGARWLVTPDGPPTAQPGLRSPCFACRSHDCPYSVTRDTTGLHVSQYLPLCPPSACLRPSASLTRCLFLVLK